MQKKKQKKINKKNAKKYQKSTKKYSKILNIGKKLKIKNGN